MSEQKKADQVRLLEGILPLAREHKLPAVIHCRDEAQSREATSVCMKVMQALLPDDQRVHLHCFDGDVSTMQDWLKLFPQAVFGLTSLALKEENKDRMERVVEKIPLQKILLETDSPYLVPPRLRRASKHSNPGMITEIANFVASVKNMPVRLVYEVAFSVTECFYNL